MGASEVIPGLDGARRQQVAAGLWTAWRVEGRGAAVLTGFSGIGKSEHVVRPLVARARSEGISAVHIDVPLYPTDLDQELAGLLVEEFVLIGDGSLAEVVRNQPSFAAALATLLSRGALVVIDEFHRMLDRSNSRPLDPLASKFEKLARRGRDDGCLWLVANRLIDPVWTEPFHTAVLEPPADLEDAQRIVLQGTATADADERFPVDRRVEVVRRLGANPRLLRLLGHLLRHYAVEELLGPPGDVPEMPPDPRFTEDMERTLLSKAKEGLSASANALLRDLCVLPDRAIGELVQAMGSHLGDVRVLTRELRERYLLEIRSSHFQVHPVVREVDGPRLRLNAQSWRAAHRRAGEWYAKPLLAADRPEDATLALRLAGARYHLTEAQAPELLREAVRAVGGYIGRKFDWSTPRPASAAERDARIALLDVYLEEHGPAATEYQLAKLLKERAAPGDLEKALPHAERGTAGQDFSVPWVLWVQIVREVQGLETAVVAARKAAEHVAPAKNLYAVYQLLGACLDHLGRTEEAVEALLEGAEHAKGNEHRLVEGAVYVAAAAATDDLLERLRDWAQGTFAPLAALSNVALLERQGQWGQVAEAARDARNIHSTYLHLALHEALCWLGTGDPASAQAALERFPGRWRHEPREGSTWLAALVALHMGETARASKLLATYLDATAPTTAAGIRAALLREWDHRVATVGEANPAWSFPILPPAVTGHEANVVRPQYGSPVLPQHRSLCPGSPASNAGRLRILAVATEWHSGHGGLTTLNRQLCCALAAARTQVTCIVLKATQEERSEAESRGVTLIDATPTPGLPEQVALARKPVLPDGFVPDIIIGHGRVTGPAAQVLAEDHFPLARRLHFVHMAPDEIEWLKLDRSDDAGERAETRTQIELDLGRTADRVVAVGPRLHDRFLNELSAFDAPSPLRLDPGFDAESSDPREPPPGKPWKVLLLGRLEDKHLKGLDLAARAVGLAASHRGTDAAPLELLVRGARLDTSTDLRDALCEWAGLPSLSIVVRPYTTDTERLDADLRRASLVLMPSRSEGFGLVGLEAIVAGTPVLVSSESGLGALLRETLEPEQASRLVVRMSGDDDEDSEQWGRAVEAVLRDREAAFLRAAELRTRLSGQRTWAAAAAGLLAELDEVLTKDG
jgi:glycosyltransferase involved in cell wall biosynthesis